MPDDTGQGAAPPAPEAPRYIDVNVQAIALRYGGMEQAVRTLFRDARRARDGKRKAEEQVAGLKEQLTPKPGQVTLHGDDATAWNAWRALGKTPAEVTAALAQHDTLQQKVQVADRKETASKASRTVQWNADALATLALDKNLNIVLKQEKDAQNADVERAYVQPTEAGSQPVPLTDYVKQHLGTYLPMLTAPSGGSDQNGAGGATDSARRTPYVEQGGTVPVPPVALTALPGLEARVLPSQRNKS